MSVKLLFEKHLEFLSLKDGCTGSSESTRVKMPHCWKSHVAAPLGIMPIFGVSIIKQNLLAFLVLRFCKPLSNLLISRYSGF